MMLSKLLTTSLFLTTLLLPVLQRACAAQQTHVAGDECVVPDSFRIASDGDDDAPSFNRALQHMRETHHIQLCLGDRLYWIRSPILQDNMLAQWYGQGWSESIDLQDRSEWTGHGSWLVVTSPDFQPITVTGPGSRGSSFEKLAFAELQPQNTSDPNWQPTRYPFVVDLVSCYGMVSFRQIMFYGITAGITARQSGRLVLDTIYGQVFDTLVKVDKSYDSNQYSNIHLWPYWSQDVGVMAYVQSRLNALWLLRADTGNIDNLFVYGANSAIRLDASLSEPGAAGGAATKNTLGIVHCDATRWCIWVTGHDVHFQAANIDSQGQRWSLPGSVPMALKAAAAIRVDGQAIIQVGNIWQEFSDHSTISLTSPTFASNIQIGSIYEDFRFADATPSTVTAATVAGGGDTVTVAMPPMIVSRSDQVVGSGAGTSNAVIHIP